MRLLNAEGEGMSALQGRALASGLRRTPVHHWVVKPRRIITPSYCAPFPFNLVLPTHTSQPASAAALIGHGADGGAWRAFCATTRAVCVTTEIDREICEPISCIEDGKVRSL